VEHRVPKRLTTTVDADARESLDAGYKAIAADQEQEREAMEWIEGVVADVADQPS
jgi:hypothetical protein